MNNGNGKMNLYCGAANPNIIKATDLLNQYDSMSVNKYINAKKITVRLQPQCRQIVERNLAFRLARKDKRDGIITTEIYLSKMLDIYKFISPDKKKENLESSDEEDDSISLSTDSVSISASTLSENTARLSLNIAGYSTDEEFNEALPAEDIDRVRCKFCNNSFKKSGLSRHHHYCLAKKQANQ